jgi:ATP-binding protein involved in chromosome partitioning
MALTTEQVVDILQKVIHPATKQNIISMGLVKNLLVEGEKISFTLAFEKVNDPLKSSIQKACITMLKEELGENTEVDAKIITNLKVQHTEERGILPGVKNIIAVASGKGGVGKSTIAVNLAVAFAGTGARVGLIDADIFGPSVPKMMGVENEKPFISNIEGKDLLIPIEKYDVKMLSIGFFVDPQDATIWRGPMASNALKQMISDAHWGELDYLFVDLPPGTSDIHLTLVQTVPVTGVVIVSTPQDVALADVIKGINMFRNQNINVPVLGLIENMAWFTPEELPDHKYYIFGKDGCRELAAKMNVDLLGQIPIVQGIREGGDVGKPGVLEKNSAGEAIKQTAEKLRTSVIKRNTGMSPTEKVEITRRSMKDFKKET